MSNLFDNLSSLVADMKVKDWLIELFEFRFNNYDYFVFVRRYLPEESKPKYSLAKIIFLDKEDSGRELLLHANSIDFINLNVKEFREFFNIPYSEFGLGDAIRNFKNRFGECIPKFVTEKSVSEKQMISNYIDSERKKNQGIYLSHVMRLPKGKFRSKLTDNKARLLRPDVYRHFRDDKTITFCFFTEKEREQGESVILKSFAEL